MENDEKVFEIRVENWAYGGEVMGRLPDGRAVFVPFALPGELVQNGCRSRSAVNFSIIGMIVPRRSVLFDKVVDQARIHVRGHVHADIVGNDEQDVGGAGRAGAAAFFFCSGQAHSEEDGR